MSQELTKIKSRIKSVNGALKVTSAMKLVSTVKLKKWKTKMIDNRTYIDEIKQTIDTILGYAKNNNSIYSLPNKATKNLYVIISSTLGLCGSYNNNIFKVSEANIKENDDAIILGAKGMAHFSNNKFRKVEGFEEYNSASNASMITKLTNYLLSEYTKGNYREIHLIYSSYKNSLVFLAKDYKLLPLMVFEENKPLNYGPYLEPNEGELINTVIPFYLKSEIYSKLLESEVCEQASRSNAMENATNNAKEILDTLQIEFNKARQAAITQEITEIVGAASAV